MWTPSPVVNEVDHSCDQWLILALLLVLLVSFCPLGCMSHCSPYSTFEAQSWPAHLPTQQTLGPLAPQKRNLPMDLPPCSWLPAPSALSGPARLRMGGRWVHVGSRRIRPATHSLGFPKRMAGGVSCQEGVSHSDRHCQLSLPLP